MSSSRRELEFSHEEGDFYFTLPGKLACKVELEYMGVTLLSLCCSSIFDPHSSTMLLCLNCAKPSAYSVDTEQYGYASELGRLASEWLASTAPPLEAVLDASLVSDVMRDFSDAMLASIQYLLPSGRESNLEESIVNALDFSWARNGAAASKPMTG